MTPQDMIATAKLVRQSYGIATAGNSFGGPRGIWLECSACPRSEVIAGSNSAEWAAVSSEDAATVFTAHGWVGVGPLLVKAKCPRCATLGRWPVDVAVPPPPMRGRIIEHPPTPRVLAVMLPDGLWERDGRLWFSCRSCDHTTEWEGEAADFELGHYANVCGGSPRCLP